MKILGFTISIKREREPIVVNQPYHHKDRYPDDGNLVLYVIPQAVTDKEVLYLKVYGRSDYTNQLATDTIDEFNKWYRKGA